jgi:cation-transporting ATPase 13A3/4/5
MFNKGDNSLMFLIPVSYRFTPFVPNEDDDYMCYENTAVFFVSAYQYVILAVTFSKGAPYRKSMLSNCKYIPLI